MTGGKVTPCKALKAWVVAREVAGYPVDLAEVFEEFDAPKAWATPERRIKLIRIRALGLTDDDVAKFFAAQSIRAVLPLVYSINLGNNKIKTFPMAPFESLPSEARPTSLRSLDLSGNRGLKVLPESLPPTLGGLVYINIGFCPVRTLENTFFVPGAPKLPAPPPPTSGTRLSPSKGKGKSRSKSSPSSKAVAPAPPAPPAPGPASARVRVGAGLQLTHLPFQFTSLREVPDGLIAATAKTLRYCQLPATRSLPSDLHLGQTLGSLTLDFGRMKEVETLPRVILHCKNLHSLVVVHGGLKELPRDIYEQLPKLETIMLRYQHLDAIPVWMRDSKRFDMLALPNNRMLKPPESWPERKSMKGFKGVPETFREIRGWRRSSDLYEQVAGWRPEGEALSGVPSLIELAANAALRSGKADIAAPQKGTVVEDVRQLLVEQSVACDCEGCARAGPGRTRRRFVGKIVRGVQWWNHFHPGAAEVTRSPASHPASGGSDAVIEQDGIEATGFHALPEDVRQAVMHRMFRGYLSLLGINGIEPHRDCPPIEYWLNPRCVAEWLEGGLSGVARLDLKVPLPPPETAAASSSAPTGAMGGLAGLFKKSVGK